MLGQINPHNEELRAQRTITSLTENGRAITRVFDALKPNRRPMVDDSVQQVTFSAKDHYTQLIAADPRLSIVTSPK